MSDTDYTSHSCAPDCAEHPFSSGYDWSKAIRAVTPPGEASSTPVAPATFPGQVTRYGCPIGSCDWTHDDGGPSIPAAYIPEGLPDPGVVATAHAMNLEGIVREHLETHPLIEWAREVARLRDESQRGSRDAGLVTAVLLHKLGGSAEIDDADLAAESGTLIREPAMHGFRLRVQPRR